MLDQFVILHKGGLILFKHGLDKLDGDPVNVFIQQTILENRVSDTPVQCGKYILEYLLLNEHDLVILVVYEKLLASKIGYVKKLLSSVSHFLMSKYESKLPRRGCAPPSSDVLSSDISFRQVFEQFLVDAVQSDYLVVSTMGEKKPMDFFQTKKAHELNRSRGMPLESSSSVEKSPDSFLGGSRKKMSKLEALAMKRKQKADAKIISQKGVKVKSPSWKERTLDASVIDKSKIDDLEASFTDKPVCIDDMSFDDEENDYTAEQAESKIGSMVVKNDESGFVSSSPGGYPKGIFTYFSSLVQTKLSLENLAPVMESIHSHLVSKNVATDVADSICESVTNSMVGLVHSNFLSIDTAARNALEEVLTRILTPKRNIDIVREVKASKDAGRPYTIVFVGVNGVGKSTSLAKVCAYLLKQKFNIMIAACDTFRSGAVEQLKVHAKALGGITVFDKGYGKDAAYIAQQAIAKAHSDGTDVVLVDTAGRMQDNEPLMASLAKLIKLNNPNLILFVGEALVGNDCVDQVIKFNRALEEHGDVSNPRYIDGLILTKFDTVDDKVGSAISLVHTTGQPIVFVGVGQTYSDLRMLNVKKIVDILARDKV